jgi:hypothetical protein
MRRFFKKRVIPEFGDTELAAQVVATVATFVDMQMCGDKKEKFETVHGINQRALGYVYGMLDAALQSAGEDIRDPAIGPPLLLSVFRLLFPTKSERYREILLNNIERDGRIMGGMFDGGQDFTDFLTSKMPPYRL